MAGTKNSTYFDVFGEDSEYFDSPQLSVTPETEQTTSLTTTPQTTTALTTNPLQRFSYLARTPYGNYNTTPVPMFDHPAYDPNAGRLEAYDREYARYMSDLRNSGRRRVNLKRANQAFEQRFNESWQQGELGRRNAYLADRRQKLDEYWNSRKKEHEDAIAEAYRQEGYTFDEATGKWSRPLTHGLDFNNTTAVQEWLMNHGQKLEQYGADGHYGTETNNAVTAMLNDPNINLSEEERQKFMNLQTAWLNKLNQQNTPAPATVTHQSGQSGQTNQQQNNSTGTFDFNTFKQNNNISSTKMIDGKEYARYDPNGAGDFYVGTDGEIYKSGFFGKIGDKLTNELISSNFKDTPYANAYYNLYNLIHQNKRGGTLIKKHKQGGNMELDIQAQVKQLVQAVAAGDQLAAEQVKQIMQAAEQGDQQALQIAQMILAEIEAIKSAKRGAKLNYIKSLKGNCPEGEEVVYFKKGGEICKACQKKHDKMIAEKGKKLNPIEEFKKGRKTKKC